MAGNRCLKLLRFLCALYLAVIECSGCFTGWTFAPGPPEGPSNPFQSVHVESVEAPGEVHAGQLAVFVLHLSANADPAMLQSSYTLYARTDSTIFTQGVASGRYEGGQFFGLHIVPTYRLGQCIDLGIVQASLELPVTFAEAGPQVMYIGHNRHSSDGGRTVTLPGQTGGEYPAEDDFVEYMKIEVNVAP